MILIKVDIEDSRKAFEAFFSHYPYCYGYWKKYSDVEKRNGDLQKAEEVRDCTHYGWKTKSFVMNEIFVFIVKIDSRIYNGKTKTKATLI